MKNIFHTLMFAAAFATVFTSCSSSNTEEDPILPPGPEKPTVPTIEWIDGEVNDVHEITDQMSIKLKVAAPEGIKVFTIDINSPALTPEVLGTLGLAKNMDLINPATENMGKALNDLGFPIGSDVKDATEVSFDLSTLVPMIKSIFFLESNHNFRLTIKDNADQTLIKTLKFHLTGTSTATYNNDADLWTNMATLTADIQASGDVGAEYKKADSQEWIPVEVKKADSGKYLIKISPRWTEIKEHASGATYFAPDPKTGVFPGNTYQYRLSAGTTIVVTGEFTVPAGQTLPYGDMNTWSQYVGYSSTATINVDYPNPDADNVFWSNGNNNMVKKLCTPLAMSEGSNNRYAHLKGGSTLNIFAAGNLFTGAFEMNGLAGYARFGQVYEFTARPTALKLRYKATVGTINTINPDKTMVLPEYMLIGQPDPARIFVCITDWSDRHSVHSGMGVKIDQINGFDPVKDAETAEGKILAYGSKTITENIGNWTEVTIPIFYEDKVSKPAAGNYSLVISCASSAYGDYLCGSTENELNVDDFEWVY